MAIETVSWEQLQQYVYEADGSWRDIYVLDASRADWKIRADFVNANYRVTFVTFTDGDAVRLSQIDFATAESYWDGHGQANMPMATFFVEEMPIRCHFFRDDEVENDIDPRNINSFAVHQQLYRLLDRTLLGSWKGSGTDRRKRHA
ncbi:hypothetical protein [Hymenobacter terricola]|uniref:hypothetical protein n=1 Tax=Hymenobacter terricola TaxID=2819236 RepID=UPI001B30D2EE|nr:hypothetical protein [Hymenobacter terricola]